MPDYSRFYDMTPQKLAALSLEEQIEYTRYWQHNMALIYAQGEVAQGEGIKH